MHYDPLRYAASSARPSTALVDRWSTETSRNFRLHAPNEIVLDGEKRAPLPSPPPPPVPPKQTVGQLAAELSKCVECQAERHSAPLVDVVQSGQVLTERPPFHCYLVDTPNVLPPRPIREPNSPAAEAREPAVVSRTEPVTVVKSRSQPSSCKGCKICHHFAAHGKPLSMAVHAEMVAARREAQLHQQHTARDKKKTKGSSSRVGDESRKDTEVKPAAISAPTSSRPSSSSTLAVETEFWGVLRSTDLFLCESCNRVTRRVVNSTQRDAFLAAPCEGCGLAGYTMRLLCEDRRPRASSLPRPGCGGAAPASQDSPRREHTILDPVIDTVNLLSKGVVPMTDRRTALGERIHVGRKRVPSPAQRVQEAALAEGLVPQQDVTAQVKEWVHEPLSANESLQAKLCLTWGS